MLLDLRLDTIPHRNTLLKCLLRWNPLKKPTVAKKKSEIMELCMLYWPFWFLLELSFWRCLRRSALLNSLNQPVLCLTMAAFLVRSLCPMVPTNAQIRNWWLQLWDYFDWSWRYDFTLCEMLSAEAYLLLLATIAGLFRLMVHKIR